MAFDGITVHALVHELNNTILNGRIDKIAQPERDEILLTIKTPAGQKRLMISSNASLPLVYLIDNNKPSPLTAPGFCMLLRKHLNNGRITAITQPGLERIIDITFEHMDELGDLCTKHLMIELMGKHSNIIFTDNNNKIIDSIKRINASVSSVREVLPGYPYFVPNTTDKLELFDITEAQIKEKLLCSSEKISKAIYTSFTGLSPEIAEDICNRCETDSSLPVKELNENDILHLSHMMMLIIEDVRNNSFEPAIFYNNENPAHFSVLSTGLFSECEKENFSSLSELLNVFYSKKNANDRIRQRSADLRQIISTALNRNYKKYDLQEKQLKDTEKRDHYRIYGELLNTYGYNIEPGSKEARVLNYYTNEEITIPLDENLSPQENSQKFFARYNKLKRTYEALSELIRDTKAEIDHLESINTALDIARDYDDLTMIKEELTAFGFIKKNPSKKGKQPRVKNKPIHYISSDGFDIFVGKNNLQNEEITFEIATGNDWWFHAKNMPGSHVIVKTNGKELTDRTFEEAAALAGYYSKGREYEKVEIDYIQKKHVKKVAGAAPGFVIYHTNYSMIIAPEIRVSEI